MDTLALTLSQLKPCLTFETLFILNTSLTCRVDLPTSGRYIEVPWFVVPQRSDSEFCNIMAFTIYKSELQYMVRLFHPVHTLCASQLFSSVLIIQTRKIDLSAAHLYKCAKLLSSQVFKTFEMFMVQRTADDVKIFKRKCLKKYCN